MIFIAKPEREWNIFREKCFTPARIPVQCHGFGGAGLNEGNELAGMDFASVLNTDTNDICEMHGCL